jgi:hypothetical protein
MIKAFVSADSLVLKINGSLNEDTQPKSRK